MPQDHARALRERRPMTRRARQGWGAGTFLIIAATLVVILLTSATPVHRGCIDTQLAGAMGAEPLHSCGSEARVTCATVKQNERTYGPVGLLILERACRAGQLPVG